ncbi:MAG: NUDIX domain-containing protein [Leptolyngbyaceae cyanobacterium RU_5_1]|nr:NUDIX domain-containing protein [Leptolyngbyaceae cyanobacterium RU_5_1]
MADLNTAKDEAFGIVPILCQGDEYQFLLIQHHAGHWGFPKGHAEPNESTVEAACREFAEETGISDYTLLGEVSFSEQYTFTRNGQKFYKTVVYYPAFVQSPTVQYQKEEIQNYVWLDYDRAIALLTFEGAKRVLTEVKQHLETLV